MKFISFLKRHFSEYEKWAISRLRFGTQLTIEFPPEAVSAFDDLQLKVGAARPVEVLKKAIPLYDKLADHLIGGGTITLKDEKGEVQELKIEDLFVKVPSEV